MRIESSQWSQEKLAKTAISHVKADKYMEILHPEYEQLTEEQQYELAQDKTFIIEHIEEIDELYAQTVSQAEVQGEVINKQEILRSILSGLQPKQITPQQIGKATKDVSIEDKRNVEDQETTLKNYANEEKNMKEGEEPGDDN